MACSISLAARPAGTDKASKTGSIAPSSTSTRTRSTPATGPRSWTSSPRCGPTSTSEQVYRADSTTHRTSIARSSRPSHTSSSRSCSQADKGLGGGHPYLAEIVQPGNFIITSNWDLLIERYAQLHDVPLRHSGTGGPEEVVLLKLHGSIDWCLGQHMAARPVSNYAMLNERLFASRPYRPKLPAKNQRTDVCVRIRAMESWSSGLSIVRSRASEPHMATMSHGKTGELGPLRQLWRDAYGALSRAARLEVVGYSMPPDDIEIRTLLRAGVERGADLGQVVVRNPTPDVHDRIRRYLDRNVESDYRGISML